MHGKKVGMTKQQVAEKKVEHEAKKLTEELFKIIKFEKGEVV